MQEENAVRDKGQNPECSRHVHIWRSSMMLTLAAAAALPL
jgi:hypothetical protein